MAEERNNYQIARKDAKSCFVESLNDSFPIGRVFMSASVEPLQKSWRNKVAPDRMAKVFPVWPSWYPQIKAISFLLRAAVPARRMPRV